MRALQFAVWLSLMAVVPATAQTRPQTPPPPRPGVTPQPVGQQPAREPAPVAPSPTRPQPAVLTPGTQSPAPSGSAGPAPAGNAVPESAPTEAQLGLPIYPGARFLRSYDAGQGQRYYLFGATAPFVELVTYYRTALKERGDRVYDEPPVHMFEIGRFREETMAFPPGVTVKDYTWGGSKGYLVGTPGSTPDRYPTIIQIVPVLSR